MRTPVFITILALVATACGSPPQTSYEDTEAVETLDIGFGSTDVQQMASDLADSLNNSPNLAYYKNEGPDPRLRILLSQVRNKTEEHIDMRNIMNTIRTKLLNGGHFRFAADQERREDIKKELEYMQSGAVEPDDVKNFGKQIGADVFLAGELTSIVKKSGGVKIVHYKMTLMLEHLEKAEIIWQDEKEIRKRKG